MRFVIQEFNLQTKLLCVCVCVCVSELSMPTIDCQFL
uniref:Uncharacterized protein n=1 Tax=Anguilla anguilla TaxID=7936 RepID=A0A0E9T2Z5_ANGAN